MGEWGEEKGFSPSALSLFRFHLSPFPPETPDTQAITTPTSWLTHSFFIALLGKTGRRDPLDFVLLAPRSGYFFPRKLIINHKPLQRCQFVVRKRNEPYLKNWSLSTPV